EPARFHPKLQGRKLALERRYARAQRRKIDFGLAALVRNPDPAAQIDDSDLGESLGKIREKVPGFGPVRHVEYAAAGVGVQTDDAGPGAVHQRLELCRLGDGPSEFRMRPGGSNVMMMTPSESRVDAQEYFPAAEQLGPHLEGIQVVQRHMHAELATILLFAAGREVRREQHALRGE